MLLIAILIGLLIIHYSWILGKITKGIVHHPKSSLNNKSNYNKITVLIPFRNESDVLLKTLTSISQLKYKHDDYEVIFINDHSTDNFKLDQKFSSIENIKFIQNKGIGKKEAIKTGIKEANFDWILCSDADCIFNPLWLDSANQLIESIDSDLYILPVIISPRSSFIERFQYYDSLSTLGFNIGYNEWKGVVLLASGANLLYKKELFSSVDPYKGNEKISSGDDIFLLEEFRKKGCKIFLETDENLWVQSDAVSSLQKVIDQRVRWVKKMGHLKSKRSFFMGFYVLFIQLILWLSLAASFNFQWMILVFIGFIVVKTKADFNLMQKTASIKGLKVKSKEVFIYEFVYMLFVPFIVLISIFRNPEWKGRKISS